MSYKFFVKKEEGKIIESEKIYVQDLNNKEIEEGIKNIYEIPEGFEELTSSADSEYQDYIHKVGKYEINDAS